MEPNTCKTSESEEDCVEEEESEEECVKEDVTVTSNPSQQARAVGVGRQGWSGTRASEAGEGATPGHPSFPLSRVRMVLYNNLEFFS